MSCSSEHALDEPLLLVLIHPDETIRRYLQIASFWNIQSSSYIIKSRRLRAGGDRAGSNESLSVLPKPRLGLLVLLSIRQLRPSSSSLSITEWLNRESFEQMREGER